MLCPNCGCQLSEGAKFCSFCGTSLENRKAPEPKKEDPDLNKIFGEYFGGGVEDSILTKEPESQSGYYQPAARERRKARAEKPADSEKPRKKGKGKLKGVLITILSLIVAGLIGRAVETAVRSGIDAAEHAIRDNRKQQAVMDSKADGGDSQGKTAGSSSGGKGKTEQAGEEYLALFRAQGIEPESVLMGGAGDYYALAETDEDGWIYQYEFLCWGDEIHTMADCVYIPLTDYSDEEVAAMEEIYKDAFAEVDALDFCRLEITQTQGCLKVVVYQEDMDYEDNVQALRDVEYLDGSGGGLLSISLTREGMLADGLVEY